MINVSSRELILSVCPEGSVAQTGLGSGLREDRNILCLHGLFVSQTQLGEGFLVGYKSSSSKSSGLGLSSWHWWEEKEKGAAWNWDQGLRQEMLTLGKVDKQKVRARSCIRT